MTLNCIILTALLCCAPTAHGQSACTEFKGKTPPRLTATLQPGTYQFVMVAKRGSRNGHEARGLMHLKRTSATDRSPRTGETARDYALPETPLYGWTDANLAEVGAPMCTDAIHPAPDSQDPVYPGVLVYVREPCFEGPYSDGAPCLAIGTASNPRNGQLILDGCGIGLQVQAAHGSEFVGIWNAYGGRIDGSGHFCLRAIRPGTE